jgi:hypothetical protein
LLQVTRTVPIVAPVIGDPVAAGFADSLARPGGNVTGFMSFEYGMAGKWLELLKETVPSVTRAAVLRDPQGSGTSQFAAIQAVAPSLRVEVNPVNMRDAGEIERAVAAFARSPNGGLIVTGSAAAILHRDLIVGLAARYKLPAVYYEHLYVTAGGLISYGPDFADQYRSDLRSERARDLHPERRRDGGRGSGLSSRSDRQPSGPAQATRSLLRTAARPVTLIASSKARSRPTYPYRRRRSISLSSTLRPQKHWASQFHRPYSPAPMR